jgi:hypothetical protein
VTEGAAWLLTFGGVPGISSTPRRLLFTPKHRPAIRFAGPAIPPTPVFGESYAHLEAFDGAPSTSTRVHRILFGVN